MTRIEDFISEFRKLEVKLWVEQDQLRFRAPKGRLSEAHIAALKQRKPEVIAFLTQVVALPESGRGGPRPVPRNQPLPLSFAQQRLWFLDRFEGPSPTYNLPTSMLLRGELDDAALEAALGDLVQRHEVLRTHFGEHEGRPVLLVEESLAFALARDDITGLDPDSRARETIRRAHEDAATPFDLANGPLIRAALIRCGEREHAFLLNLHHIVSDGWSIGIFMRELAACYRARLEGRRADLPALPIQYADYAYWQQERAGEEGHDRGLDYWKRKLTGAPPLLELPTDFARPPRQTFGGEAVSFRVTPELSRALTRLAQNEGASLFMVMLAVFKILLARYAGQADISVGSPYANRERPELEGLIGFFLNTLVLRSLIEETDPFRTFLAQVAETTLDGQAHGQVPLEQIVEAVRPERALNYSPLFQVLFTLLNRSPQSVSASWLPGLETAPLERGHDAAHSDLSLTLVEGESINGRLVYNRDLFEHATVTALAGHYLNLLAAVAADPGARLTDLSLLGADERRALLAQDNDLPFEEMYLLSTLAAIEATAARIPGAAAVTCGADRLDFGQLNRRANRLARYLATQGIGEGSYLGICLEHGLDLAVAILAAWKRGAVYVPLDPNLPPNRLAYIVADMGMSRAVSHSRLAEVLPDELTPVFLDRLTEQLAFFADGNTGQVISPHTAANIVYTSGSTGRPKGVVIMHHNHPAMLRCLAGIFQMGEGDAMANMAAIGFDIALGEMVLPLMIGARVHMIPRQVLLDMALLERELRHVNYFHMVPRLLTELLAYRRQAGLVDDPPDVRLIFCGGDAITPALLDELRIQYPHTRLFLGYGPSETNIISTGWLLAGEDDITQRLMIGRVLDSSQGFPLDTALEPVPVGVPGEFYIGGPGVGGGYLGRPDLTAERFIPHPFSDRPGKRLYRSGDRVRRLVGGHMEFLGRIDNQVKIRGMRIELGEIEMVLENLPSVTKAAVLAVAGKREKQLAAFLVAGGELTRDALRTQLRATLPEYMIPSLFLFLETLPLNANGKLDRAALLRLPLPEPERATGEFMAPLGESELRLAAIWRDVLGVERVGRHDNFFNLGGHSLLATRVLSRVRDEMGRDLPVRIIFEAPRLAELARLLEASDAGPALPLLPLPAGVTGPLSFAQQRLWFLDRLEGPSPTYNIPVALRLRGSLDPLAMAATFLEIVRRHESLRTRFPESEGRAGLHVGEVPATVLVSIDLSGLAEAGKDLETHRLIDREHARCFDLERGPLFRAWLLRRAGDDHVLLINQHHIISDGWSSDVLIGEMVALYTAFGQSRPSPLPALPIQYGDFAHWQRTWLEGGELLRQLDWWRAALAEVTTLELPCDRPRPPLQRFEGRIESFRLPAGLAENVRALSRRHGASLFMTLLAVFKLLLARYSGQADIAVGSPIANRNRSELEGLIGFFVNTLVLRTRVDVDASFESLLARVVDHTLEAYAHQDVPFEKLVEAINPVRSMSVTPLFQVMFVLHNAPSGRLRLPGLHTQALPARVGTDDRCLAKFDLTLGLRANDSGLTGALEYNADLFERETVCALIESFTHLLTAIVADPGRAVGDLPIMDEAGRRRLLAYGFGATPQEPERTTLAALFEARVAANPQAIALQSADPGDPRTLTYAECNRLANKLAWHLCSAGARPGMPVGLFMERQWAAIVAVLGIIKAGAAYLPIDPGYPAERQQFMLDDCALSLLVTRGDCTLEGPRLIDLDRVLGSPGREDNPPMVVDDGFPAYILFTSGSTGRPKGTVIPQRGVVRLVRQADYADLSGQVVAQIASLSFDASTFEIWGALLNGNRLVVLPREFSLDPPAFAAALTEYRISMMVITTAVFNLIVTEVPDAFDRIDTLMVGGEALDPGIVRQLMRPDGPARFLNVYGPTEATTYASIGHITELGEAATRVPIGLPVSQTETHVLDHRAWLAPAGTPGELWIGGPGLALGYLNRPALTAAVFVPHPYAAQPGARLYKTSDRVRRSLDGSLAFLGRIDNQVKVRGFRIELGEIERALLRHDGLEAAAVVVHGEGAHKRLAAYLVAVAAGARNGTQLRQWLAGLLPEFMIPSFFTFMDALPINTNGKVDRKRLPVPEAAVDTDTYSAPSNPTERALAEIWSEVLGVERVGVNQNFFELGGDSILSIQVISRANRAGLGLSPRHLFENQTIARLAQVVSRGRPVVADQAPIAGTIPLTPVQAWFFEQIRVERHHFNQAVMLASRAALDRDVLQRALAALVARHDALRMRFRQEGSQWIQDHGPEDLVPELIWCNLSGMDPDESGRRMRRESAAAQAGFDLARGPLLAAVAFHNDGDGDRLLLVCHHLVVDGVSWRFLLQDLVAAYHQARDGRRPALPPKTSSFKAWAEHLADYAGSGALAADRAFWTAMAAKPFEPLPVDGSGPNTIGTVKVVDVSLSPEQTERLLRQVPAAYHTEINDILLTALLAACGRWTGRPQLRINLEGHGREFLFEDLDISQTCGWFTSIYPVHLDGAGCGDHEARIKAVKEQLRQIPRKGIGYGILRYGAGDEELAALPRPQLSFNYLGRLDAGKGTGGGAGPAALYEVDEPVGAQQGAGQQRTHLIDVTGQIAGGRLTMHWIYSSACHEQATITGLAKSWREELEGLIDFCCTPGRRGYTPSDFPVAPLDQPRLDALVAAIGQEGRGPIEDIYPLSPLQQGMLFHSIADPESGHYVVQVSHLLQRLDVTAWRKAWSAVIGQHPIFRTRFHDLDGTQPLQLVFRQLDPPIEEHDWRDLDMGEQKRRLTAFIADDRRRGLALDRAPLMRLTLIRLGSDSYRFIWTHHHAIIDGWSMPIVMNHLSRAYVAARDGRQPELGPIHRFRDYIEWVRGRDAAETEAFWTANLAGFDTPTVLNLDRETTAQPTGLPQTKSALLPEPITRELQSLARRQKTTVNVLCQAAWSLLLCRYSGTREVVFGATTSGRPPALPDVEQMVGPFINTLPVRAFIPRGRPLSAVFSELHQRQVVREQFSHTPLVAIQRWIGLAGGTSLFDSLLVFENYPDDGQGGNADDSGFLSFEQTHFPLSLILSPERSLYVGLNYDPSRFEETVMETVLGHFLTLLEGFTRTPHASADAIDPLTPGERSQILELWNRTDTAMPTVQILHRLFEARVYAQPDRMAVIGDGEQLSFASLNRRANQLARQLRLMGVAVDDRVAVCLPRSPALVVAILAVLKAGAAFIPIDATYPAARIAYLLEDARPRVLITSRELTSSLPAHPRTLPIEALDETLPDTNLLVTLDPANLAYVIYTSGTTGRPKGVQIPHLGISNTVQVQIAALELTPADRVLQYLSVSFDGGVCFLFESLCSGASLHLLDRVLLMSEGARILREEKITYAPMATSTLAALKPEPVPDLRALSVGGDAVHAELVDRWGAGRLFRNVYGPTECSVITVAGTCRPGEGRALIGRVCPHSRAYVLDEDLRPVPRGIPGELWLAGISLARGYFRRPALTAEKFVPDPFSEQTGQRLYRTGDLVRYRSDGTLDFLGRIDNQVKIRGYRIELGEIEAALLRHPSVHANAVLVTDDGSKRLSAFVVYKPGAAPPEGSRALRRFLADILPDYMVPVLWQELERLPRTPNDKADTRALSALVPASAASDYQAPQAGAETVLAEIWAGVLGRERVGRGDNFFELGGDSILGLQIIARARARGLSLSPKLIFENQVLADLAAVAGGDKPIDAEQGPVTGALPLTPIQHWFFGLALPHREHWNMDLLLAPAERPDLAALAGAVRTLLEHHDALRLRFEQGENGWTARIAEPGGAVPFEWIDGSRIPEQAWIRYLDAEATRVQASLDLARGPLVRFAWFDRGDTQPGRLLIAAHHLCVDAVSLALLSEDFRTAYTALAEGRPVQLPPKTTSLKTWAQRLADHAAAPVTRAELAYWSGLSRHLPNRLPENGDANHGGEESCSLTVRLSEVETTRLLETAPAALGTEINDLLLTALLLAFNRWTQTHRLFLDLEGHGREDLFDDVDLSRTVGWFTTSWPLLLETTQPDSVAETLAQVVTSLRAVPRHGIGFGLLRYLDPLAHAPLRALPAPQVGFNYLGRFESALAGSSPGFFRNVNEACGAANGPGQERPHVLDINGWIAAGRLQVRFSYSRSRHQPETIANLAGWYLEALGDLLSLCDGQERAPAPPRIPPSASHDGNAEEAARTSLVAIRKTGSRPPLFCIHPAGGAVLCYAHLARALGEDQPCYGLQARGLDGGEPFDDLAAMAAWYIRAMQTVQPHGPYHLLGWSFGGKIAYEMARQLTASACEVAFLGLCDAGVERFESPPEVVDNAALLASLFEDRLTLDMTAVADADEPTRLAHVLAKLVSAGLLPAQYSAEDLRPRLAYRRAAERATLAYRYQPYPGRLFLFRASDDTLLGHLGPDLGWSSLVADLKVVPSPGSHQTMMSAAAVTELAARIRAAMDQSRGKSRQENPSTHG